MEHLVNIYGIKNCGSVKKTLALCKELNIPYVFIDLIKNPPTRSQLNDWLETFDIHTLLNNKGKTYHTLRLKERDLDDAEKKEWLLKEPRLFKRPIITIDHKIYTVGFHEEIIASMQKKFL